MSRKYNPNDMARLTIDKLVADNAKRIRDIHNLVADNARLREALKMIVAHQEKMGGGLAVLSATRRIAQNALDGTAATTTEAREPTTGE